MRQFSFPYPNGNGLLAKPTLKELLLTDFARADLNIPPRGKLRRRAPRAAE
jgi:hypothetical protein